MSLWPVWSLQEGDQRWINTVAQALHLLSTLYGSFPNCYGIGRCAKVRLLTELSSLKLLLPLFLPTTIIHGRLSYEACSLLCSYVPE
jgi:hypothetical protein